MPQNQKQTDTAIKCKKTYTTNLDISKLMFNVMDTMLHITKTQSIITLDDQFIACYEYILPNIHNSKS